MVLQIKQPETLRLVKRLSDITGESAETIVAVALRERLDRLEHADEDARDQEDPMLAMLASLPVDDEPVTDEDRRHLDEGWQAYRDGQVVTAEEVRRAWGDSERETRCRPKPRAAT
jgi:hypothetical protein